MSLAHPLPVQAWLPKPNNSDPYDCESMAEAVKDLNKKTNIETPLVDASGDFKELINGNKTMVITMIALGSLSALMTILLEVFKKVRKTKGKKQVSDSRLQMSE